jgi:16S rRNA (uracil1498-N3)-methyltransferase
MNMRRFIISSRSIRDGFASFDGDVFNHMVRVLRLGPGEEVQLIDEKGTVHSGVINQVAKEWVAVKIVSSTAPAEVLSEVPRITVCQALPKGEKLEFILQKGTELGADEFWLFGGRRSVAKVSNDQLSHKYERWNRIVSGAARQSGRTFIPTVRLMTGAEEVSYTTSQELRLILWEDERDNTLAKVLKGSIKPRSIIVAIGPEGGFDPREVQHFKEAGFVPVTLGSRILRTETASIAILAVLQYIWGEM